jgi:hypothetical protein
MQAPQPRVWYASHSNACHGQNFHSQAHRKYNRLLSIVRLTALNSYCAGVFWPRPVNPRPSIAFSLTISTLRTTAPNYNLQLFQILTLSINPISWPYRSSITSDMSAVPLSLALKCSDSRLCNIKTIVGIEHALIKVHEMLPANASQADFHREVRLAYHIPFTQLTRP